MFEQEIRIKTPDGPMRAFVVHPDAEGPFPIAVLYMDAPGYREQLKVNARRFAAEGYYVAVPDLYHHFGEDVSFDIPTLLEERMQGPESARLRDLVNKVTPALVEDDTRALLTALATDPAADPGPKVTVGYCMGARCVLNIVALLPDEFVAGAGIHPGPLATESPDSPHLGLESVRAELWLAFAEHDDNVSADSLVTLREAMARSGVSGAVEQIPGTYHGYAMGDLPVYDEQAAERHFAHTLDLWRRNLAKALA